MSQVFGTGKNDNSWAFVKCTVWVLIVCQQVNYLVVDNLFIFIRLDIQNFETYAEGRKDIEKQQKDGIVEQLQILVQNFQAASEKLSTSLSGSLLEIMQTQLTTSMKRWQNFKEALKSFQIISYDLVRVWV